MAKYWRHMLSTKVRGGGGGALMNFLQYFRFFLSQIHEFENFRRYKMACGEALLSVARSLEAYFERMLIVVAEAVDRHAANEHAGLERPPPHHPVNARI